MHITQERAAIELLARMIDKHVAAHLADQELASATTQLAISDCTTTEVMTRALVLGQFIDALMDSLEWSPQVKQECRELLARNASPRRCFN